MKERIKNLIVSSIEKWTDTDIYVISLFVYDDGDNPCKPTVALGYNTETKVKEEMQWAADHGFAAFADDIRWNYANWLQNEFFCFGRDDTADTVRKWIAENNLPYYEDDDEAWQNSLENGGTLQVTRAFVQVLIDVVKEIHAEKIVTAKFGRELPIIIHELEYYDEIAEQNIEANGEELVKDFVHSSLFEYTLDH